MFSDHSIAPISAPDTCSPAPAIVIQIGRLSPARPDQQIQSFINIDLYINSAREHSREPVQSTALTFIEFILHPFYGIPKSLPFNQIQLA